MKTLYTLLLVVTLSMTALLAQAQVKITNHPDTKLIEFGNDKIMFQVDYHQKCAVTSMLVNGEEVIAKQAGVYSMIKTKDADYSTLNLLQSPQVTVQKNKVIIGGIVLGAGSSIHETWTFNISPSAIDLVIDRSLDKALAVEEVGFPRMQFKSIDTWNGAFLDYGGLAWFYLFNSKLCTYGVHSSQATFWNSQTANGLRVSATASGKQVVSKFTRLNSDALEYSLTVSTNPMTYKHDPGTQRRRYLHDQTDVWSPFELLAGKYQEQVKFAWVDYTKEYGRGQFKGIDGAAVSNLLNTIARIGVIDKAHFGGNSWHTPYGPICLHEQYIAQMGIGINDPSYINGYKDCLTNYKDNAIQSDGRVLSRWAYTDEDAMAGTATKKGFYEAQWGYLLDSNPDFVANVSDTYQQTGDLVWVKTFKSSCEKALDYMLKRDSNGNHLVEMINSNRSEHKSSDWIDIVWASYENAFVNAKLYHALTSWATIETQLGDAAKACYYANYALELKKTFNKSTKDGGFWDEANRCYVYWRDNDQSVHGSNVVIPVNFMAISYGICDDSLRATKILNQVEKQMKQEHLFAWPLCLYPFQEDEVHGRQFPFPEYENGDIFLSWGSIGVDAYSKYKPEAALQYVQNILEQYKKDGLAYQRYLRNGQQGAGDDILSGNALALVGLYTSIYGINPKYNRLYLNPHLAPSLNGTQLNYNYRGQRLKISLSNKDYAVANEQFKVSASSDFGFNASPNQLHYFHSQDDNYSLLAKTQGGAQLSLKIGIWNNQEYAWEQTCEGNKSPIAYTISQLRPNAQYDLLVNGKTTKQIRSNGLGILSFSTKSGLANCSLSIRAVKP